MKYTIITPTILRDTLARTCESIDNQTVMPLFEHIIWVDKEYLSADDFVLINKLQKPYRKFILSGKATNNYGNTPRHEAGKLASGKYVMYIDDDDYYDLDMFKELKQAEDADVIVFPAMRHNELFFNMPAGLCRTVSCQWMHKRIIANQQVLWTDTWQGDQDYLIDGKFLESVMSTPDLDIVYHNSKPLVYVLSPSHGK